MSTEFGKAAGHVFNVADVVEADFTQIEDLRAVIKLRNGTEITALDIDALEAAYLIKPTVVEGKRLRFATRAWVVHNLIGHPLMQMLAFFGKYELAFKVHDDTAPRALGRKDTVNNGS